MYMPILVFSEKLKEYASPSPLKYFMRKIATVRSSHGTKNMFLTNTVFI